MLKKLKPIISLLLCAAIMFTACIGGFGTAQVLAESGEETLPDYNVKRYIPEYNKVQILVDGNTDTSGEFVGWNYCTTPGHLIQKSENEIMFSYGRSTSHIGRGVGFLATLNTETNEIVDSYMPYDDGENRISPSLIKMPNGDLINIISRFVPKEPVNFLSSYIMRSTNGGETWAFDEPTHADDTYKTLEDTDGVQYFYSLDSLIDGDTLYMSTCVSNISTYLRGTGVRSGSANLIKTEDNGHTWEFVLNYGDLLGEPMTEEVAIEKLPDGGYLLICRGVNATFAATVDEDFNLIKKRNLSADCPEQFGSWCALPNVIVEDGRYYLYCRNAFVQTNAEFAFFELDIENLLPKTYVVLEEPMLNNTYGNGHMAKHYFTERDGVRYINFINYTDAYTFEPDVIRSEFIWDEITNPVYKEETENNTVYPVASALSHTDSTVPVYNGELSNLSLTFDYDLKESADWYFDVVGGDYNNCYNLALTPDGFTLNRVVSGESTALCTYTDIDKNRYYYHLELVRYMGEITLYSDGTPLMSVADGDVQYPVTATGNNTHWKGYVYLADENGAVSDIKVYDSGLITFENGVAKAGNLALSQNITAMIDNGTSAATVTAGEDSIYVAVRGNNKAVYTSGWLHSDVGDFVLTYTDRFSRNYSSKAIHLGADAIENPTGGNWFIAYDNGSTDFKNVFNQSDTFLIGWGSGKTSERVASVTAKGSVSTKVAATELSTTWGRHEVKVVKKAGKLTISIGNVGLGYHTVYSGDATSIAGNIYFGQFNGEGKIKDIKITDTEKIGAETETVKAAQVIARRINHTDPDTALYENTLSNFSADFTYKAENNATLYFDVVNADYTNCYALKLTPSGLSLDRVVSGTADTLCSYTGNTAGSIQIVRYMGEITVFIDETPVMAVASEDIAYPVTSTGANTHWYGNIYLDDANADVTGIKLYDSGLVTFTDGVAVMDKINIRKDITARNYYGGAPTISSDGSTVKVTTGSESNASAYTTAWLDQDMGDCVITYTDDFSRTNYTHKLMMMTASVPETCGWSRYFFAHNYTFEAKASFNRGIGLLSGMDGGNTFNKGVFVNGYNSGGGIEHPADSGEKFTTFTVTIIKKADKASFYITNTSTGTTHKCLDFDCNKYSMIKGNIYFAQFQGSANIRDISISDTQNVFETEVAVKEEEILAGDLSGDDSVDSTDLTLMKKKLLGLDVTVDVCKKADVNADRYLDVRDMIRLKKNLTK